MSSRATTWAGAWRRLDPPLTRFLVVNAIALGSSTVVLAVMFALGVRGQIVVVDLAVLLLACAALGVAALLIPRYGAPAGVFGVLVSTVVFAFGATWVTPFLGPLTILVVLVPVMAAHPYLARRSIRAVVVGVVVAEAALAALSELRRSFVDAPHREMAVLSLVIFVPMGVGVIAYAVAANYRRLDAQATELRTSRTLIAAVADAARRGLERDLHDGAQQRLVGMSVRIAEIGVLLDQGDPAAARAAVRSLGEQNLAAIQDLRELARGIYPPLLAERGLVPALIAAARRSALPCAVEAGSVGRWGDPVESAVYFCVLEGLQNAAKHSGAAEVTVSLRADPFLEFEVRDDGAGFDAAATSLSGGLLGMEARVKAAGGEFWVRSSPGQGARVGGRFREPLPEPDAQPE